MFWFIAKHISSVVARSSRTSGTSRTSRSSRTSRPSRYSRTSVKNSLLGLGYFSEFNIETILVSNLRVHLRSLSCERLNLKTSTPISRARPHQLAPTAWGLENRRIFDHFDPEKMPKGKRRSQSVVSDEPVEDMASVVAKEVSTLLRDRQENTRWRPTIPPPTFSGAPHECPAAFLGRLDIFIDDLRDADKIAAVGELLHGEAKEWFRRFEGIETTWPGYKARFLAKFDGEDIREKLQRSMWCDMQKSATSTADFILTKYRLWKRLDGVDEGRFVQRVIAQLLPSIRLDLYLARPSNLDELLLWAERVETSPPRSDRTPARYVAPPRREARQQPPSGNE